MLSITYISPKKINKNQWNTNHVSAENESKLDNSIKEYGMFKPILCRTVNDQLEVIGGEHRLEAAIRNGFQEVPIINLGNITDDKAKKLSLIDNGRYGTDDFEELQALLKTLEQPNDLAQVLPYSLEDFDTLFKANEVNLDDIPSFQDESLDDTELFSQLDKKQTQTDEIPAAVVKFKIPLEYTQDLDKMLRGKQTELHTEYSDPMLNAGRALMALLLGDKFND